MSERIALVTGASSGIGEATARILLESGWRVVGLSRSGAAFDSDRYRDLRVDLSDLNALTRLAEEEIAPILDARSGELLRDLQVRDRGQRERGFRAVTMCLRYGEYRIIMHA